MNPLGERATAVVAQLIAHFGPDFEGLDDFREWRDLLNMPEADAHFGLLSQRIMAYIDLSFVDRLVLQDEILELERALEEWERWKPVCAECWREIEGRPEYANAHAKADRQANLRREYNIKKVTIARATAASNPLSPRLRGGI